LVLDVSSIKEDFPIFRRYPDLVYLDNAATTHKPRVVIEAIRNFYENFNANIHRGLYDLSQKATEIYEDAHEVVAKFINAYSWEEVIFTRNSTESLNLLAYSIGLNYLQPGDEIVISIAEHHSNMLPWIRIAELRNASIRIVRIDENGEIDYRELENVVNEKTKVVSITHISNVLGVVNDVKKIASIAHRVGAIVIVDGAQSVPHIPIDVKTLDIDFLVFSGHKMLSPMGIGVLWGRKDILMDMDPPFHGGDMVKSVDITIKDNSIVKKNIILNDLPWKFEPGTANVADAIGLVEAIRYLIRIGLNNIDLHEKELARYTIKRLEEYNEKITILGSKDIAKKSGIISFVLQGLDPQVLAYMLSTKNIAIRAGFHCAQPLHQYLGLGKGSDRISFYIYNDYSDIDRFVDAIDWILKELGV